jgi:aspartate/methionine/tyrosine aminotransferase
VKEYNLGWGHSVAVRQAFLQGIPKTSILNLHDDALMNYGAHEGDARLIEVTRKVIERQVGPTYNHILLTNGATGGVTIALRAYAQRGCLTALTRGAPYFPIYPAMIKASGLRHVMDKPAENCFRPVLLIDSPSNPYGDVTENLQPSDFTVPVIWDAVYHSRVYTSGNYKPLGGDVLVGSYSKLLGLNGIRTGWIATNDSLLYARLHDLVTAEYCGLSNLSSAVLLSALKNYEDSHWWNVFETRARLKLDDNRNEWSKLQRYFGHEVKSTGMFYYSYMDSSCQKLLEKSGISWTKGSALGTDDNYGRFNLGQDCTLLKHAVREVLKNDKS